MKDEILPTLVPKFQILARAFGNNEGKHCGGCETVSFGNRKITQMEGNNVKETMALCKQLCFSI